MYTWNVDRYIRHTDNSHIETNDTVLLWQPRGGGKVSAGIYAYDQVSEEPSESPNEVSNWQVGVTITRVLAKPVSSEATRETGNPDLLGLQILKMAGGHVVFRVSAAQWGALQKLFP